jgi:zinc protease
MKMIIVLYSLILTTYLQANENLLDSIKRYKINDLEVVWVRDDKFPKYTASIYFSDGAYSDSIPGLTKATFEQLTSGTSKLSEKEINEVLDFYAASVKSSVTHEYSILTVQGLTKDISPVISLVCDLFNDSQFPNDQLESYKSRGQSQLKNLITNHSSLADRVFRMISFQDTEFSQPVEGNIEGLGKLKQSDLKKKLARLNGIKKVLYISGPKESQQIANLMQEKCSWKHDSLKKSSTLPKMSLQNRIYLVPVTDANQAQIRIGRYLTKEEIGSKFDRYHFLAGFLGGGFTSKLVQELRVKRGLTYSAGSYVSIQREYARAGIQTFTKSETVDEVVSLISDIFSEVGNLKTLKMEEFNHAKSHQVGSYAFAFEAPDALLGQLMLYDHQGRKETELVEFPKNIQEMIPSDLSQSSFEVFQWDKLSIVVVGDRSLEKELSKIRPVKIIEAKSFL